MKTIQAPTVAHRISPALDLKPHRPDDWLTYAAMGPAIGVGIGLPVLSAGLLTLAYGPIYQFYFAWIGLVPWLVFLSRCKSQKSAFWFSWLGGFVFFTANMWWMSYITIPGMFALMIYCGVFWALAAVVIRGGNLLNRNPIAAVFLTSAVWVGFEWLRGNLFTGLPWMFLGHSQSPILAMCQVADIAGAYGVSFWVAAVNVLIALMILRRPHLMPAIGAVVAMVVLIAVYGFWRIVQTKDVLKPGPMLALIQSNYPQDNSGSKGAFPREILQLHSYLTRKAEREQGGKVDLAVWSETMMPPINSEAIELDPPLETRDNPPMTMAEVRRDVSELAQDNHVNILTGGEFEADWHPKGEFLVAGDRRNSAFFFDRDGHMDDSPGHRYDKIHLVPWGEFIPFQYSFPPIYKLSLALGPSSYQDYVLRPGSMNELTVFHVSNSTGSWRFVTPICFEDIDAYICAAMFRPGPDGAKRADFLVNLTNDGWFKANENADHLQSALFRTIENRAWMALSVNTGISGFVDSTGKLESALPVRVADDLTGQVMIDPRLTIYTRFGDVFALACSVTGVIVAGIALFGKFLRKAKS